MCSTDISSTGHTNISKTRERCMETATDLCFTIFVEKYCRERQRRRLWVDYQESPRRLINSVRQNILWKTAWTLSAISKWSLRAKMPQGQKNKIEVELQRDWRLKYNAEHTENIDGWSADNVYGGWQLSQEVRDTSVGKAHQEYNNIHISNAEQCNCLGFGTRINVATGTTHEPNGSLPPSQVPPLLLSIILK